MTTGVKYWEARWLTWNLDGRIDINTDISDLKVGDKFVIETPPSQKDYHRLIVSVEETRVAGGRYLGLRMSNGLITR